MCSLTSSPARVAPTVLLRSCAFRMLAFWCRDNDGECVKCYRCRAVQVVTGSACALGAATASSYARPRVPASSPGTRGATVYKRAEEAAEHASSAGMTMGVQPHRHTGRLALHMLGTAKADTPQCSQAASKRHVRHMHGHCRKASNRLAATPSCTFSHPDGTDVLRAPRPFYLSTASTGDAPA